MHYIYFSALNVSNFNWYGNSLSFRENSYLTKRSVVNLKNNNFLCKLTVSIENHINHSNISSEDVGKMRTCFVFYLTDTKQFFSLAACK